MRTLFLVMISVLVVVGSSESACCQSHDPTKEVTDRQLLFLMNDVLGVPQLAQELDLVDHQVNRLKKIASEAVRKDRETREKTAAAFQLRKSKENLTGDAYKKAYSETYTKLVDLQNQRAEAALKEIEDILIPSQIKFLRQYGFRSRFNATLAPFKMLRITFKQVGMNASSEKKANKELDLIQARYTKEIEKLRQKTINEVLDSLDKEHADKIVELIGKRIFPPVR